MVRASSIQTRIPRQPGFEGRYGSASLPPIARVRPRHPGIPTITQDLSFYSDSRAGILTELGFALPPGIRLFGGITPNQESLKRALKPVTVLSFNDIYDLDRMARLAHLLKTHTDADTSTLKLFAGDALGGGNASIHWKGEQMIAAFNRLGIDAAVVGNHDFDFGLELAAKRFGDSNFPWLAANLVDRDTGGSLPGLKPWHVIERGGVRTAVMGLVEDWLASTSAGPRVRCLDPMIIARELAPWLRRIQRVDYVVALTHMDTAADYLLATVPGIDLIVGGHDHLAVFDETRRITKAQEGGRRVGRLVMTLAPNGGARVQFGNIQVDDAVPEDPGMARLVRSYEHGERHLDKVFAISAAPLSAPKDVLRARETAIGNLVTDAYRRYGEEFLRKQGSSVVLDAAIANAGAIRATGLKLGPGPITVKSLMALIPTEKKLVLCRVRGEVLLAALENGVSLVEKADGRFLQVSGIAYAYDPTRPSGQRVTNVTVGGIPLESKRDYTLILEDFLLQGGDGYEMLTGAEVLEFDEPLETSLAALLKMVRERYPEISGALEGRIIISSADPF